MKLAAFLIVLTILRLSYIGQVDLSPDEAYYHQWSQRLDWCYFSKGPGIALAMKASTSLFGHGEFGVRAFAPLLALGTSLLLFWLARRMYDPRVATWTVVLANFTPLFNVGGLILSIDPLSIFFWTATLCTLWMALEKSPAFSGWWALSGLLIGAGFLCKWTNAFLLLSVLLLLAMTPRYRKELKQPGFYTMLAAFLPALIPVYLWQDPRGWPILNHLSARGGLETPWWKVNLPDFFKFLGSHFGVYSPLIFAAMLTALWLASQDSLGRWLRAIPVAARATPKGLSRHWSGALFVGLLSLALFFAGNFWEQPQLHKASKVILLVAVVMAIGRCKEGSNMHWKPRFLVAFSLPVVAVYFWIALHHDSEVNWTAPAAVTVFILTVRHWIDIPWPRWKRAAFGLSAAMTLIAIQPDIVRAVGIPWPLNKDHTSRLRGWKEAAEAVNKVRTELEQHLGEPIFLIAEDYGLAGELCHYLPPRPPERPGHPACYVEAMVPAANQFHFWGRYDDYEARTNAVVNQYEDSKEYGVNPMAGRTALYVTTREKEMKPPSSIMRDFESWKMDREIVLQQEGQPLRMLRFFICHRYKPGQDMN